MNFFLRALPLIGLLAGGAALAKDRSLPEIERLCQSCHSADPKTEADSLSTLSRWRIARKLRLFRSGHRRHGASRESVREIVQQLSNDEIRALARHFAKPSR